MDRFGKSHRHKAEVIEVYENGLKAAVKFYCSVKRGERIECVVKRGITPNFALGMTGMVDYGRCLSGYEWTFTPNKEFTAD